MNVPTSRRTIAAGAVAITAYLAGAFGSAGSLIVRPLYDGTGPPPAYRWVNPPEDLAATNEPPAAADELFPLGKKGSEAFSAQTADGQAAVTLPEAAIRPRDGEAKVRLVIEPLDPAKVAAPPPGFVYDGNAYDVRFLYAASGEPAVLITQTCPPPTAPQETKCFTISLRYPIAANSLYRWDGATWTKVEAVQAQFALFGDSAQTGIFVAAHPKGTEAKEPSRVGDYIAIAAGGLATILAIVAGRVVPKRRRAKEEARAKAARARRRPPPKSRR